MPPVKQKGNSDQDQIFLIGLSVFGAINSEQALWCFWDTAQLKRRPKPDPLVFSGKHKFCLVFWVVKRKIGRPSWLIGSWSESQPAHQKRKGKGLGCVQEFVSTRFLNSIQVNFCFLFDSFLHSAILSKPYSVLAVGGVEGFFFSLTGWILLWSCLPFWF